MAEFAPTANAIAGILAASRAHPEVAAEVARIVHHELRPALSTAIGAVLGPDHPLVPTLADTMLGLVPLRCAVLDEPVAAASLTDEFCALVEGVRARKAR